MHLKITKLLLYLIPTSLTFHLLVLFLLTLVIDVLALETRKLWDRNKVHTFYCVSFSVKEADIGAVKAIYWGFSPFLHEHKTFQSSSGCQEALIRLLTCLVFLDS